MTDVDYAVIYRSVRLRVADLVRNLPADVLVRDVPATPAWRVRDVVAHLAGGAADVLAGNLEDVASEAWIQAQVDARIDVPFVEVLEDWDRCSASVEPTGTVRTSRLEIVRAGVGRRSYEQIGAWDWDGETFVESVVLGRFSPPRPDPLVE